MTTPSYENACRIFAESLDQIVFTLDERGDITSISPGCNELLGFLPEEMMGKPISSFGMPEGIVSASEKGPEAPTGKMVPSRFSIIGKDGVFHHCVILSRSVFEGREETGMIGIIGDNCTRNQAENKIRQANTRLHAMNSLIRHDINNQLTVLNGYLSLMQHDDTTIMSPEIVRILLGATDKIHKMILFTKEYQELGTRLPAWTNLFGAFQSALSTVETTNLRINPDISCQEIELFTDPMMIKVFHHLIDNSLRHGKVVSEISLRCRFEDGLAIIVYGDNGTGISESLRSILFQPGKLKNTGYGLYLVHEILALEGFTITETGTPGKGVRFEIVVPAGSFRIVKK